jgi:hypothetical protein
MKVCDLNLPVAEFAGDDRTVRFVSISQDQAKDILAGFGVLDGAIAVVATSPKKGAAEMGRVPRAISNGQTRRQAAFLAPIQGASDSTILALMIAPTDLEQDGY